MHTRPIDTPDALDVQAHADTRGRGWVEITLTTDAAEPIARAVRARLAAHTTLDLRHPAHRAVVTRVIRDAVTSVGLCLSPQHAEDLGHALRDAADECESPEFVEAVMGRD